MDFLGVPYRISGREKRNHFHDCHFGRRGIGLFTSEFFVEFAGCTSSLFMSLYRVDSLGQCFLVPVEKHQRTSSFILGPITKMRERPISNCIRIVDSVCQVYCRLRRRLPEAIEKALEVDADSDCFWWMSAFAEASFQRSFPTTI